MLHPIFIKASLKQFPGSEESFWEQVSLTVEALIKDGSLYVIDAAGDKNGFTTPRMETFPVTPVRPKFDFVSTFFGKRNHFSNPHQQETWSEERGVPPERSSGPLHGNSQYVSRGTSMQNDSTVENIGHSANEQRASLTGVANDVTNILPQTSMSRDRLISSSGTLGGDRYASAGVQVSSTCASDKGDHVTNSTPTETDPRISSSPNTPTSTISVSDQSISENDLEQDLEETDTDDVERDDMEKDDRERYDREHTEHDTPPLSPGPSRNSKRPTPDADEREGYPKRIKTIGQHEISSAEVLAEFRLMKLKVESVTIVTNLLNNIGTLETIQALKDACLAARETKRCFTCDDSIESSATAIAQLEDEGKRSPLLLRYHWSNVVRWRDENEQRHQRDGCSAPTATKLATNEMMKKMHPRLQPEQQMYATKRSALGQMCSYSRQWLELQKEFSIGLLAVIPGADLVGCAPFQIAKMKKGPSQVLLRLLLNFRGEFLRALSQKLLNVYDVLLQKRPATRFKFENVEDLRDFADGTDQLLDLCTQIS
ncbi:hypothetical protein M409DRAFT_30576 [Zasmidium cellare ATCC 36951]|uniref:Uncharacterized protein n=1 Tax=Zasmidium cellare ATCC 36951 TaxID=1080233 RepID=A0A6A6BVW5_ZASCE|nr:uncharacterized protein M409DRAFT_30576 [Zasmidium cellare ATCC 36951]KAF2158947.1 hypothetical protein M409DRAFT_30576 [Zasmidium cellare ATCC 36951]